MKFGFSASKTLTQSSTLPSPPTWTTAIHSAPVSVTPFSPVFTWFRMRAPGYSQAPEEGPYYTCLSPPPAHKPQN